MICPNCGSPCREVAGVPRSITYELMDLFAEIVASANLPKVTAARAHDGMAIITAVIDGSPRATPAPRDPEGASVP
jgi:hypothetical protein